MLFFSPPKYDLWFIDPASFLFPSMLPIKIKEIVLMIPYYPQGQRIIRGNSSSEKNETHNEWLIIGLLFSLLLSRRTKWERISAGSGSLSGNSVSDYGVLSFFSSFFLRLSCKKNKKTKTRYAFKFWVSFTILLILITRYVCCLTSSVFMLVTLYFNMFWMQISKQCFDSHKFVLPFLLTRATFQCFLLLPLCFDLKNITCNFAFWEVVVFFAIVSIQEDICYAVN